MFCASTRFVAARTQLRVGRVDTRAPHFAAVDAGAALAALLEFAPRVLPQVRVHHAGDNLVLRDVALDALDADPRRHHFLQVGDDVGRNLGIVRHPVARVGGERRTADQQRRVKFQHVGLEIRLGEEPCEVAPVLLGRHSRQARHQVVDHFQPRFFQPPRRRDHIGDRLLPVELVEHRVVKALHPDFDPCRPLPPHLVHSPVAALGGTRLHRQRHAAVRGGGVGRQRRVERIARRAVQRPEGATQEFVLVFRLARGEGAAHDNQLDLVGRVAVARILLQPSRHLRLRVVAVSRPASRRRLVARIRLRRVVGRPAGTVGAGAVRTGRRRSHDGDRRDAGGGAHWLDAQQPRQLRLRRRVELRQQLVVGGQPRRAGGARDVQLDALNGIARLRSLFQQPFHYARGDAHARAAQLQYNAFAACVSVSQPERVTSTSSSMRMPPCRGK